MPGVGAFEFAIDVTTRCTDVAVCTDLVTAGSVPVEGMSARRCPVKRNFARSGIDASASGAAPDP